MIFPNNKIKESPKKTTHKKKKKKHDVLHSAGCHILNGCFFRFCVYIYIYILFIYLFIFLLKERKCPMGVVDVIFLAIGGDERQMPWLLWRVHLIVIAQTIFSYSTPQ
jgi:hypothetical protein